VVEEEPIAEAATESAIEAETVTEEAEEAEEGATET
jgi:hypothetical protein